MSNKQLKTGPIIISTIIALFIVVLVPLLRNLRGNPFSPTMETYTHLNILSSSQPTFYDFALRNLVALTSPQITVIVLPLLLALGSLILFVLLLRAHITKRLELCSTILVLALTPAFLSMHIGLTLYAVLLFFTLLTVYLYKERYYLYLFFLSLLFLLDPLYATLVFAGIFFLEFFRKENKHAILVLVAYSIILVISALLPLTISFHFPLAFNIDTLFSFLGGRYGYSLFLLLLGIGGFLAIHSKTKLRGHRALQALILVLSIFYEPARIVGVLLLAYYAVQGFVLLLSREWHTDSLQQLTALLFVCILIFSTTSYIKEEINQAPTEEHIEALQYLRATIADHSSHAETTILSKQEHAPFVEFFSSLKVEQSLTQQLLASQSFSYVSLMFQEHDIAFVFVDPTMTQGDVWQRPDEGLLFVMKYNNKFKKIYDKDGYSIYYFLDWNAANSSENVSISRP